jgi:alkanesulfonate monooxygenase SsuD/methylene tetrahydromethanopterin reductase-like flavin-dependent oxidoreductase (luciferase family)
VLDEPYLMLGVAVVCAETDEEAHWLAGSSKLAFVRLRSGRPGLYPTPEAAAAHEFTVYEESLVRAWLASHVVGSPETVHRSLQGLVDRTGADELMVTTMVHDPAARVRSYELLAELADLQPPAQLAEGAVA